MRLLLDTHVLLWWLRDDARLRPRARALIADSGVEVLVSIASAWEVSVKHRLGKLPESGACVVSEAVAEGFQVIPVEAAHVAALDALPRLGGHKDPFDHLLLAQAVAEGAALMTDDHVMRRYGVRCIGVG